MLREQEYLLEPKYDYARSFYGKARVVVDGGWGQNHHLISYTSRVASIGYDEAGNMVAQVYDPSTYHNMNMTPTTLRHIKEFLKQHGFKADNIDQIRKDYLVS